MNFTIEDLQHLDVAAGLALTIKATFLLALGAAVAWLLRGRSAAARHFVWLLTLIGVLGVTALAALPLGIGVSVPRWLNSVAVDAPHVTGPVEPARAMTLQDNVGPKTAAGVAEPRRSPPALPRLEALAPTLWLFGTTLTLAWFALGYLGLARLARRAPPIADPEWRDLVEGLATQIGMTRPIDLRRSSAINTPLVYGLLRPGILLPVDAESWDLERRRVVLLHELAHVARRDPLAQAIAWLGASIYWFHPGAWIAAGRLRGESERACDDRVLEAGVAGPDYAAHLLSLMRRAHELRFSGSMGLAMARRSTLEKRLFSLLDESRRRGLVTWRGRAAGFAALAIALVVVGLARPTARAVAAGTAPTTTESYSENLESHEADAGDYSGGGKSGPEGPVESVDQSVSAAPGETLELDLDSGAGLKIQGWTERRVQVRGSLSSPEERPQEFSLARRGNRVVLRVAPRRSGGTSWTSNRLEIRVPLRFDVRITSAGGEVTIVNLEGSFEGSSGGGDLEIQNARGRARLSTGGGDIRVTDCELSGSVNTGGGMVMLSRVRGGLRGTSGSGPVIYAEAATGTEYDVGDLSKVEVDESGTTITYDQTAKGTSASGGVLNVEKAGGDIRMKEAPNGVRANTGGGDIAIGRSNALVDASTGGGDIEIGPVAASVRASTGAGQVHVVLASGKSRRTVDLTSGSGNIVLDVPRGLEVDLDLETSYTRESRPSRIRSDVPIQLEPTTDWDDSEGTPRRYVRARSKQGGGVQVRIQTVNGNIEIRRTGG